MSWEKFGWCKNEGDSAPQVSNNSDKGAYPHCSAKLVHYLELFIWGTLSCSLTAGVTVGERGKDGGIVK